MALYPRFPDKSNAEAARIDPEDTPKSGKASRNPFMESSWSIPPIGILHSPFKEKFGIPRQPGLAPSARSMLEILPPYDRDEAFRGLERFSHIWLVFRFHGIPAGEWRPTVRPPRLGGNRRIGVFATRSGFRPNPIGLSAVALEGIGREDGRLLLRLRGADLLDGTPVLDVKPYLPYADRIPEAVGGFADRAPDPPLAVMFSPGAEAFVAARERAGGPELRALVVEMLQADPRPAYRRDDRDDRIYGIRLLDLEIKWQVRDGGVAVLSIHPIPEEFRP
jgi:tRNA (adenine37-N6)-methyltransferase